MLNILRGEAPAPGATLITFGAAAGAIIAGPPLSLGRHIILQ